jgi:maltose alpha-D-glucosyltransferase/alpha-amylase
MESLGRYFDIVGAHQTAPPMALPALSELSTAQAPALVQDVMGAYLETAGAIGRRTADMHAALAADTTNPSFSPAPLANDDIIAEGREAMARADRVLHALEAALKSTPGRVAPEVAPQAERLLRARDALFARIRSFTAPDADASKIRIHGDYRLAQILMVEGDFYIQNFEGHPSWPGSAQRAKQSPLRDVASMLRSFSYATRAALLKHPAPKPTEPATLEPWARLWESWAAAAFLQGYLAAANGTQDLLGESSTRDRLLGLFMVDRALRELDGELNNRPDWIGIPLGGILDLLELA